MATKSIGKGIQNFPVPLIEEESRLWGKLALKTDKAKAALMREAMLIGLLKIAPEVAQQVMSLRLTRKIQVGSAACLALFVAHLVFSDSETQFVRQVRSVRRTEQHLLDQP